MTAFHVIVVVLAVVGAACLVTLAGFTALVVLCWRDERCTIEARQDEVVERELQAIVADYRRRAEL